MIMERLAAMSRLRILGSHFAGPLKGRAVTRPSKEPRRVLTVNMSSASSAVITADQWWSQHKRIKILDGEMAYYDSDPNQEKSNRAAIFLHGNPTSSYLWRNIMPRVEGTARCLAPDLIGMGRSSKLPNAMYTYKEHYNYLCAWFDAMNLPNKVTIVCHDWGSGLGLNWVYQNQQRVEALVYFEAVLGVARSLKSFPEIAQNIFGALRSEAGEDMVLKDNFFVERLLPTSIIRQLDPAEMEAYREPFKDEGEARRPTLTWPREIPFRDTGPQYVVDIVDTYTKWLAQSKDLPKLFIDGEPGFFSPGLRKATKDWVNQKTLKVKGLHFLQEDSAEEIGDAVKDLVLSV